MALRHPVPVSLGGNEAAYLTHTLSFLEIMRWRRNTNHRHSLLGERRLRRPWSKIGTIVTTIGRVYVTWKRRMSAKREQQATRRRMKNSPDMVRLREARQAQGLTTPSGRIRAKPAKSAENSGFGSWRMQYLTFYHPLFFPYPYNSIRHRKRESRSVTSQSMVDEIHGFAVVLERVIFRYK